jgi:hypothetical protein
MPKRTGRTLHGKVPPGYRQALHWKLTGSFGRFVLINLLSLPLAVAGVLFFGWLAAAFGAGPSGGIAEMSLGEGWGDVLILLAAIVLTLLLHELTHGLVMSLFGATPRYGVKWEALALYATAPGYAFTRNQYLAVILAPLATLSVLASSGILAFAGGPAVSVLVTCAVINTMGACGDLYMAYRVIQYPRSAYVIDEEDGMRIFVPA